MPPITRRREAGQRVLPRQPRPWGVTVHQAVVLVRQRDDLPAHRDGVFPERPRMAARAGRLLKVAHDRRHLGKALGRGQQFRSRG